MGLGFVQQHAPLCDLCGAEARANLLLHLRAEPLELRDAPALERRGEIGGRLYLELRVQELDSLGAEAGDAQQVEQAGGELAEELLAQR